MRKSSIYLPDGLKDSLAELATRWGRSEADLIRLAIERLVTSAQVESAPTRVTEVPKGPCLVGVGVGPSAPDLITERALAVLREADCVYAASAGLDSISRAEAVVREAVPEVGVDRLVIEIGGDEAARHRSIDAGAQVLVERLDRGELVVLVVLGDPNVYSVFTRVAELVGTARPLVPVETVPGIMAFQELAARTNTVLVEGDEELSIVTLGAEVEPVAPLLVDDGRTVVVYKGGRHLPELAQRLEKEGRLDDALVGEMLGLPGGRGVPVATAADRPASYLATVIVPARRETRDDGETG